MTASAGRIHVDGEVKAEMILPAEIFLTSCPTKVA